MKNNFISKKSISNSPLERGLRGVSYKRQMSTSAAWFVIAVIFAVIFQFLSCCKDCPTCPQPEVEKAYYVYIADDESTDPNYIWVANSRTDSLIDSIRVEDGQIFFMRITSDGRYLAIANFSKDSIYIMDTETREIVGTTPYGHPAEFSFDDRYFIVSRFPDSLLYTYSQPEWETVNILKVPFYTKCLFNKNHYLLGDISWAGKEYVIYDYVNDTILRTDSLIRADGSTPQYLELITSPDDRYLYFTSQPDKLFKFDLEDGIIIDSVRIFYGAYLGEIHNGPNNRYLFVAEVAEWPTPSIYGVLLLVNQDDFTVYRRYNTWGLHPMDPLVGAGIGVFDITPDGNKVFCGRSIMTFAPPVSIRIDNGIGSFIHGFPANRSGMAVAIGKEIN